MPPQDQSSHIPTQSQQKEPVGPMIGVGIIVILAIFGALYYWGAVVNSRNSVSDPLPLITGEDTSTTTVSTTTVTIIE